MIHQHRDNDFTDLILPDTTLNEGIPNLVFLENPNLPVRITRWNTFTVRSSTLYVKNKKDITKFIFRIPELNIEMEYKATDDSAVITFELPGAERYSLLVSVEAYDEIGNKSRLCEFNYTELRIPCIRKPTLIFPELNSDVELDFIMMEATPFEVAPVYEEDEIYATDIHECSEWKIVNSDTEQVVYDSTEYEDLEKHNAHYISGDLPGGKHTISVRYKGQVLGWSEWSDPVEINLKPENNSWYPYMQEYSTVGTDTFTVPEDTKAIRILTIGGGALGASSLGGKGGGIISAMMLVEPGETIPITVGALAATGTDSSVGDNYVISHGGSTSARGTSSFIRQDRVGRIVAEIETLPVNKFCQTTKDLSLNIWTSVSTEFPAGKNGTNGTNGSGYNSSGKGNSGTSGTNGTDGYYLGGRGGTGGSGARGKNGSNGAAGASHINGNNSSTAANGKPGGAGGNGGNGGNGGDGGDGIGICSSGGAGGAGGSGGAGGTGGTGGAAGSWKKLGSSTVYYGSKGANGPSGSSGSRGVAGLGGDSGLGGNGGNGSRGGNSSTGYVAIFYYSEKQHQQELAESADA